MSETCPTCDSPSREQRNQRTISVPRIRARQKVYEKHSAPCRDPWHGLPDIELPRVKERER